jgi:hypothetical protein
LAAVGLACLLSLLLLMAAATAAGCAASGPGQDGSAGTADDNSGDAGGGGAGANSTGGGAGDGTGNNTTGSTGSGTGAGGESVRLSPDEDLTIPLAELSSKVRFYPVTVGDTALEVLALQAPDGSYRTALNTCEVCYDSGRGFYVQEGEFLVCQNCGNRFALDQVEVSANGCNPWPIFPENKVVQDDAIIIPYAVLEQASVIFENWKLGG